MRPRREEKGWPDPPLPAGDLPCTKERGADRGRALDRFQWGCGVLGELPTMIALSLPLSPVPLLLSPCGSGRSAGRASERAIQRRRALT